MKEQDTFEVYEALDSVLLWSGGKDSTASLILAHENEIHIDKIIMSEVMFSHELNISGEDSEHIEWVYNYAIPLFCSWGYDIEVLRDKEDYLSEFYKVKDKKSRADRVGKFQAFPIGMKCVCNRDLKMRPINQFKKQHCNANTKDFVGIAKDEFERLEAMHDRNKNAVSLLEQYDYTTQQTYKLCTKYNLLSPIYLRKCNRRQGCWFCPNRSIVQFAELYLNEPKKWNMLVELSKTPNLCSYGFKYGMTIQELEQKILIELRGQEFERNQKSFFDLLEEK